MSDKADQTSEEHTNRDEDSTSRQPSEATGSADASTPEAVQSGEGTTLGRESQTKDSSDYDRELADCVHSLKHLLRRTARREELSSLLEGAAWYLAAFGAVALSALSIGLAFPEAIPTVTGWALVVGAGAVGVAAIGSTIQFFRNLTDARDVARRLQRAHRSFRNDLVAAIEFSETLLRRPDASDEELGFSRILARAHIRRTFEDLREKAGSSRNLRHLLPERNFEAPLLAFAGATALVLGAMALAPNRTAAILFSPTSSANSGAAGDEMVRPIVGDIKLTYAPPKYTEKGRTTETHSTGHIETMTGSEVTLSTYPLLEVRQVEMVLETGGDTRVLPLRREESGRLQKTLVLTKSGTYHFRATLPDGTEITDGMDRRIELSRDKPPSVTLTSHGGKVEVSPKDVLEIEFRVRDDFGVDSVERLHHFAGASEDKKIKPVEMGSLNETKKEVEGTLKFNLRPLDLKPKDVVVFRLRATDNNSRTGPGIGASEPLRLRVASPEDKHLEIIRAQRKLTKRLVTLLADYLEHPVGERVARDDDTYAQVVDSGSSSVELATRIRKLHTVHRDRETKVVGSMKDLLKRMRQDPLMRDRDAKIFESLHAKLDELHARGDRILKSLKDEKGNLPDRVDPKRAQRAADFAADMEANLERTVLRLLELVTSQKMATVQSTRKDIEKLKNRLKRLMKRYKKSNDPKLKKKIERKINRLKQRMSEMMQRLRMQIRDLPEKHLNEEALEKAQLKSGTKKLSDNLQSMEAKFKSGDIDGAMAALEKMSSNLSSFGQKMDRQFSSAEPRGLSKLDKKVSKLMDRVNDLKAAERNLEKDTEKLQKKLQRKRREAVDDMLDSFTKRMIAKVEEQLGSAEEIAAQDLDSSELAQLGETRQSLRRLRKRLENRDMDESLDAARKSLEKLQTMRFNLNLSKRHADAATERQKSIRRALENIDEMVSRGEKIRDALQRVMKRAQKKLDGSETKAMKRLARKQRKIRRQAKKLKQQVGEASKSFPMLKRELQPSLKSAEKQMKRAGKRLKQNKPQGALDSERSARQKLGQLQKSMRQMMRKRNRQRQGGSGPGEDEVEIPDQDDGKSRKDLRREVMKAMKEEKMQKYRDEIERYYKSLVE